MKELTGQKEIIKICKALSSPLRMDIIELLTQNRQMNLNELARQLKVTNGAMTSNIRQLQDADIIDVQHTSGKHGSQKICLLKENSFLIKTNFQHRNDKSYETEIPIGTYTNYNVYPTCGISTTSKIIGEVDDPRYFDDPQRSDAGILWFNRGFVEYRIPNYLKSDQKPVEIQVSAELSSEAPGICENWPSDIHFYLNSIHLGYWVSPGDFGAVNGLYTPSWWFSNWNQYGLLKLLSINREGCFIDGRKISNITIDQVRIDFKSDIIFRMEVPDDAEHIGGLTVFGKGFGNYNQNIKVRFLFE